MRSPFLPLIAVAGLAACAQTPAESARAAQQAAADQAKLARRLAGLVPGKPQSCVEEFDLRDAQVNSYGSTILYTIGRVRAYRTDTNGLCTGLGSSGNNILITKTFTGQLCQGDIAQTIDSTSRFPTGSCSFGPFVPYTRR